jgi:hypothetical protein
VRSVLERIQQLMALATSPNEHEARTAALLAVQLMKKHRIVLTMPVRSTPMPSSRRTPPGGTTKKKSSRNVKRVADPPEKIVAPLGGECAHCGARYRAEQTIYWFASGGGMHVKCFDEWARAR